VSKDFDKWNELKKLIHKEKTSPFYKECEIWWCSLGINIGFEEDGKNKLFERPVLIFRKFNKEMFWGLPLTKTQREGKFYFSFELKKQISSVILSQLRIYSSKRLIRRMYRLNGEEFKKIEEKILLLIKETDPLRGPRVPFGNI
jgi:mRNA interferase MazF